jgi:DNA-binding NarL/FixJ family response regulator
MVSPDSQRLRSFAEFNPGKEHTRVQIESPIFRVIIADDDTQLRISLENILERDGLEVVGTAKTGREAVDMTIAMKPDVLILNIRMPSMDGLTALRAIQTAVPATNVLMYTGYSTLAHLTEAIANGASGYLVKDRAPLNIPDAVRALAMGEMIVDRDLLQEILATIREKRPSKSTDDYKDTLGLKKLIRDYRKSMRPNDSSSI